MKASTIICLNSCSPSVPEAYQFYTTTLPFFCLSHLLAKAKVRVSASPVLPAYLFRSWNAGSPIFLDIRNWSRLHSCYSNAIIIIIIFVFVLIFISIYFFALHVVFATRRTCNEICLRSAPSRCFNSSCLLHPAATPRVLFMPYLYNFVAWPHYRYPARTQSNLNLTRSRSRSRRSLACIGKATIFLSASAARGVEQNKHVKSLLKILFVCTLTRSTHTLPHSHTHTHIWVGIATNFA